MKDAEKLKVAWGCAVYTPKDFEVVNSPIMMVWVATGRSWKSRPNNPCRHTNCMRSRFCCYSLPFAIRLRHWQACFHFEQVA